MTTITYRRGRHLVGVEPNGDVWETRTDPEGVYMVAGGAVVFVIDAYAQPRYRERSWRWSWDFARWLCRADCISRLCVMKTLRRLGYRKVL